MTLSLSGSKFKKEFLSNIASILSKKMLYSRCISSPSFFWIWCASPKRCRRDLKELLHFFGLSPINLGSKHLMCLVRENFKGHFSIIFFAMAIIPSLHFTLNSITAFSITFSFFTTSLKLTHAHTDNQFVPLSNSIGN